MLVRGKFDRLTSQWSDHPYTGGRHAHMFADYIGPLDELLMATNPWRGACFAAQVLLQSLEHRTRDPTLCAPRTRTRTQMLVRLCGH